MAGSCRAAEPSRLLPLYIPIPTRARARNAPEFAIDEPVSGERATGRMAAAGVFMRAVMSVPSRVVTRLVTPHV